VRAGRSPPQRQEDLRHLAMSGLGNLRQLLARLALGFGTLGRVTASGFGREEGIEHHSQIHFPGPAVPLIECQRDAVSGVDPGKQEGIQRVSRWPQKTPGYCMTEFR